MPSIYGFNYQGQHLGDYGAALRDAQALQARGNVVCDEPNFAVQLHDALPQSITCYREVNMLRDLPERERPLNTDIWYERFSAEEMIRRKLELGLPPSIYHYGLNEPAFSEDALEAETELMLKSPKGMKWLVGNWSIGLPSDDSIAGPGLIQAHWEHPKAMRFLEVAHEKREDIIICTHEGTGGGVIWGGVFGGHPGELWIDGKFIHRSFVPVENWPTAEELSQWTLFHAGRIQYGMRAALKKGLKPRWAITECSFDETADMQKGWMEHQPRVPGQKGLSGFWNHEAMWKVFWPQWSVEQAAVEQLKAVALRLYRNLPLPVEFIALFQYAINHDGWKPWDWERAVAGRKMLLDFARGEGNFPHLSPAQPLPMPEQPNQPPADETPDTPPTDEPDEPEQPPTPVPTPDLATHFTSSELATLANASFEAGEIHQRMGRVYARAFKRSVGKDEDEE